MYAEEYSPNFNILRGTCLAIRDHPNPFNVTSVLNREFNENQGINTFSLRYKMSMPNSMKFPSPYPPTVTLDAPIKNSSMNM